MLRTTLRLLMLARLPRAGKMPLLYAWLSCIELLLDDAFRFKLGLTSPSATKIRCPAILRLFILADRIESLDG